MNGDNAVRGRTSGLEPIAALSREDNELLTRVANNAPMGRLLAENFWIPAIQSHRLVAGGAPLRARLLGRNFAVFRAGNGRIGFFNEACPHRRVSLLLGRNEDNALTCIFHGWKFGVDGAVLAVPTEAYDEAALCRIVPLKHYPTREAAGLVWVFLGQTPPPFPDFEFLQASGANVATTYQQCRYNWVQSLDGLADSAHIGVMHQDFLAAVPNNPTVAAVAENLAPTYEFLDRPAGFRFAAVRELDRGRRYVRISEYVAPWFTFISYPNQGYIMVTVPQDDETTAQYVVQYSLSGPVSAEATHFDDPADWPPYPRGGQNGSWGQDREAMARGAYSGFSIHAADFAVAESQGAITDRSEEFLHDGDAALIKLRRLLIDAAAAYRDGVVPELASHRPGAYSDVKVADLVLESGEDWRVEPMHAGT